MQDKGWEWHQKAERVTNDDDDDDAGGNEKLIQGTFILLILFQVDPLIKLQIGLPYHAYAQRVGTTGATQVPYVIAALEPDPKNSHWSKSSKLTHPSPLKGSASLPGIYHYCEYGLGSLHSMVILVTIVVG